MKEYTVKYYDSGHIEWHLDGKLHREDGPAIVYPNGSQCWYINGERHREDGPAIVYPDGRQVWYINGKCHREDGPAIVYADGTQRWYIHGEELTEAEFNARKNSCAGKVVEIEGKRYTLVPVE